MLLNLSNPLEYVKSTYKKIIHPEAKGNYPLLDRCIAYVLPTAAAGTALYFDSANAQDHKANFFHIPAVIGGYIASQFALTAVKPHVANMKDGILKSSANFIVEQLDIFNDFLVLIPAFNVLPQQYAVNKVFAFDVMPEMVKGIESDLKNWWNKKDYEGEVAGRVYASGIAGGISRNVAKTLSEAVVQNKQNDAVNTKFRLSSLRHYSVALFLQ